MAVLKHKIVRFNDGGEADSFDDLFSDLDLDTILNELENKESKPSKKKYAKKKPENAEADFGKVVFGGKSDYLKKFNELQGYPSYHEEEDTQAELRLRGYLKNWVNSYGSVEEIFQSKDLLKELRERYPIAFKPQTEKGALLFRGLKKLNDEMIEELTQVTKLEDYIFVKNIGSENYVLLKIPINYKPRKKIQSWTDNLDVAAKNFGYSGLLVTRQDDDYFMNKDVLEILYGANEDEVLHIGEEYKNKVYFAISFDKFRSYMMPKLKGDSIKDVATKELTFKQGGVMKQVKKGGITYGKSHAEGGIKVKNASTGDMLEVEGGEGIVNKRSMASDKQVKLNGKEMSLCEAVSQLNQMEGGVQFNCDDVSHRQFLEEMALGGELERGTRTEKEHIQVLKDLYAKRITPDQATKRIAKDHIKEDSRYYSKLAKMEGKMAKGGKIADVDNLEGSIVKIYDAGVKDPIFFIVKSARMSDPSFRYKTLFLTSTEGYSEEIDDTKIEAFLRGEQIQMKTRGTNDNYALQLTNKKMKLKHGGKTDDDCGCGLTYAEGGFTEDKSPIKIGEIVYIIEPKKPRNEWLRGVYLKKVGKDAQVLITDKDANQFEKTLPFSELIKLDIAQANPSDFKEFIDDFGKAKSNYFDNINVVSIIESKIEKAKKYPHPDPAEQKKILDTLQKELGSAKTSAEQGKKELSGMSNKPSAFYRYSEGGMVTIDNAKTILEGLSSKVFDLGFIKRNEKALGKDFSTIWLQDLSIPVTKREKYVAKYIYSTKDLPTTKIQFDLSIQSFSVFLSFSIATRNLREKSIDWTAVNKMLDKLGFNVNSNYLDFSIIQKDKSKKFNFYFRKNYYNLFKSKTAIVDLIEYFKVLSLMLIIPMPDLALENRDGQLINNMREVFANGEIETNIESKNGENGKGGGYGGGTKEEQIESKIKEFFETYDEQKESPKYFKPKTGESEAKPILRKLAMEGFITKEEWNGCVNRAVLMDEFSKKIEDLPSDSVLRKVLYPKIIEYTNVCYEVGEGLAKKYNKTLTFKFSEQEMNDFPILMMKIWQHQPSLDSSIFEE